MDNISQLRAGLPALKKWKIQYNALGGLDMAMEIKQTLKDLQERLESLKDYL